MSDTTFDYVIIGAGTAGCLLANRLSADPSKRVLLIEAGSKDDYHWIHIPVGYLYCIGNPRTDWLYYTEADAGLNGRKLRYPRGKTLGGCSSINGMIYMRGQARDYDEWAQLTGDASWTWDQCLPYFKKHEDYYKGADALHGAGGEWRVERQRLRWDILDAFAEAAQQAGIPHSEDFNRGNNEGVGYFQVNQKNGWRWNTAKAFLRPICYGRPNFEMWTNAHVRQLRVETLADGSAPLHRRRGLDRLASWCQVDAEREVLLCAGSIGSPQLLQLSGIGPADLLQRHGIPVVHDLPGVGDNLQDHLQIRAVFKVQGVETLNTLASSWWGKARDRAGVRAQAQRTDEHGAVATRRIHAQLARAALAQRRIPRAAAQPGCLRRAAAPFNAFTASVCNLNPTSRGSVRIRSPRFDDRAGDRAQLPEHARGPAGRRRFAARHAPHRGAAGAGQVPAAGVAARRAVPDRRRPGAAGRRHRHHDLPSGGHDAGWAATTTRWRCSIPQLRVRGVPGLRVVDAGAMPTITSGNTNSPTLMMAEKAAEWIVRDARNGG